MKITNPSMVSMRVLGTLIALFCLVPGSSALGQVWCGNPVPPSYPPPPPSQCHQECPACNGSPCYARSGVFLASATDLQVPAAGPPLAASRTYNSAYLGSGLSGPGWAPDFAIRLSYSVYLYAAPSTYLKEADVRMPGNRLFSFTENPDGVTYAPPFERHDTLVKLPDGSWSLTIERSRTVWLFSQDGSLASITDEYGNVQSWSYDAIGRVQTITDVTTGRYIDIFYGADGRVSAAQDNAGRLVEYTYNTDGTLATVTDPLDRVTTYAYTPGRFVPLLRQIKDNWNRVVATMTYDSADRIATYNEDGETYTFDYSQLATQNKTIKKDSQNNQWVLTTSANGYVTDRTAPNAAVSHKDFNADGSTQGVTDEVGIRTAYTYDSQGRVLTATRDATHSGPRTDYTYHANFADKVTAATVKNPSTNQVDPNWQSWQYDYYQTTDPAPGALHHVYRVEADGTTLDTVATYTYDSHGRITQQITATGGTTDYTYSAAGDPATITGPANNDLGTRPVTTYDHDALGRVTSVTDPLGNETTYTYDAVGRILTVTLPPPTQNSPLVFTTTYSYDTWDATSGLVFTTVTDPNGHVTHQGYDQLGRLVRSVDALGNATTYAYTRDLLTSITDANNNTTSYTYDALKRLTGTTFPDGASETYTYWNDGLLHTKTDRKGQTITYAYDDFKRLASKAYPNSTSIAYTYQGQQLTQVADSTVSPTETHTFGHDASYRVSSAAEGSRGTLTYTYAADDRMATMSVANGPTTTYSYYPDGSLDTIEWSPVVGEFEYTYTLTGQYDTITFPNGQTRSYSYDDQGRLTQLANVHPTVGTLASFAYGYDIDPQTQQPTLLGQRTSLAMTIPSQSLANATSSYRYDTNYQLTQATYPAPSPYNGEVHSWTYDGIGNRLTNAVDGVPQVYTYLKNGANPLNGQRLSSDSVNAYTFDANGNTLTRTGSGGNFTFGWNTDDRMTSISGSATASYAYDYQGRRAKKTVSGATTAYLYDGLNLVRATGATTTVDYLFGPGIDEPLASVQEGNVSHFSVDGLGSVALLGDASGNVQNSYLYDAWGVVRSQTSTVANGFGYTAREVGDANLWNFRARYYQSGIGRFASEDPTVLGELRLQSGAPVQMAPATELALLGYYLHAQGVPIAPASAERSWYQYAAADPATFSDPSGLGYIPGWGNFKVDPCCSPRVAGRYRPIPEGGPPWPILPPVAPGEKSGAIDAVYWPGHVLKIPDNCRGRLICSSNGMSGALVTECIRQFPQRPLHYHAPEPLPKDWPPYLGRNSQ